MVQQVSGPALTGLLESRSDKPVQTSIIPLTCKGRLYTLAMEWSHLSICFDTSNFEDAHDYSSTVTHVALSGFAMMLQEDHMEQALGLLLSRALPSL